jgi:hypothetical protein
MSAGLAWKGWGIGMPPGGPTPACFDTTIATTIDQGEIMNLQSHLDALKGRHADLETRIAAEDRRPRPDDTALSRMKLEKLRLKEEMERLKVS